MDLCFCLLIIVFIVRQQTIIRRMSAHHENAAGVGNFRLLSLARALILLLSWSMGMRTANAGDFSD
jgi:hypothetical protein